MATQLAPMMIAPQSFDEWMTLAATMAKSQIVPKEFRERPGDVLVAMQMGVSVGLSPFQAIQSIAVINGRPCMWGDAVLGVVMSSPAFEDIDEDFDETTMAATCTVKRKGKEKPVVRKFSLADAKAAMVYVSDGHGGGKLVPLADKPGPWKAYPKRMLQMRARAWALRDAFPDVLKGVAVREEVEDYDDTPKEPRLVGGQTLEERAAEMMPREKAPAEDTPVQPAEQTPTEADAPQSGTPAPPDGTADSGSEAAAGQLPTVDEALAGFRGNDQPTAQEEAALFLAPKKLTFTVGKQEFVTNGVTRAQLMELFKICPRVGKKCGPEKPQELLRKEFGLEHRADLTEEQAERYYVRLREMLEGA